MFRLSLYTLLTVICSLTISLAQETPTKTRTQYFPNTTTAFIWRWSSITTSPT